MATKIICTTPKAITGDLATFAMETDLIAPYKFHWKKDGAFIAGSPSAKTYTTPPMHQEDMRAKFSVMVYGQDATEESDAIAINAKVGDPITIANRGVPKPAWQPFKEETP